MLFGIGVEKLGSEKIGWVEKEGQARVMIRRENRVEGGGLALLRENDLNVLNQSIFQPLVACPKAW